MVSTNLKGKTGWKKQAQPALLFVLRRFLATAMGCVTFVGYLAVFGDLWAFREIVKNCQFFTLPTLSVFFDKIKE